MLPHHSGKGLLNSAEGDRVLGFYKVGGPPTVLETEGKAYLTALHEQVHFDDISNTLWGFILRCEEELSKLPALSQFTRWRHSQRTRRMLGAAWDVLEGSAVCSEVLYLMQLDRPRVVIELVEGLPKNYSRAAGPMIETMLEGIVGPAKQDLRNIQHYYFTLAHKVAFTELALDLQFLPTASLNSCYADIQKLALKSKPKKNLRKILRVLPDIDFSIGQRIQKASIRMDDFVHPAEESIRLLRLHICILKQVVAEYLLDRDDFLISDIDRVNISNQIRKEIEREWPGLRRLIFREQAPIMRVTDITGGKKMSGSMQDIKLNPDEFLAEFENDDSFLSLMPEADQSNFTCRLIWCISPSGSKADGHFVSELSFSHAQDNSYVAKFGNLIRHTLLSLQQLQELESNRSAPSPTLAWLGFAKLDHEGCIEDWDFWSSRVNPVYLWSPLYNNQSIIGLRKHFGSSAMLRIGPVPGPLNLTLLLCKIGTVTIFWIDSGPIPLDVIQQNGRLQLNADTELLYSDPPDDVRFRAAYVSALHIMPNLLQSLGIDVDPS